MGRAQAKQRSFTEIRPKEISIYYKALLYVFVFVSSVLATGYLHIYGSNHAFQLVFVHKAIDPALYPNDPIAATMGSYAAIFWYGVAWVAKYIDLSTLLFILFLVNRLLFLWAGFRLGQALFPNSRYAGLIAMVSVALLPNSLFADAHAPAYTQQTGFAVAFALMAIDAYIRKQWLWCAFFSGMTINMNLMFGVFLAPYILATWMVAPQRLEIIKQTVACGAGAVLIGLPGIYLLFVASTGKPAYDPMTVWQVAELSYPNHFFPQTWEASSQLLALALAGCVLLIAVLCRAVPKPTAGNVIAWTATALGWYLLAVANPLWIHSLPLLHLHPARALLLWQILASLFLATVAAAWAEQTRAAAETVRFSVLTILLPIATLWFHFIGPRRAILAIAIFAFLEATRLFLSQTAAQRPSWKPLNFAVGITVLSFGLFSVHAHWRRVAEAGHWSGIKQHTAYTIAAWAREHTDPTDVFLIPITSRDGWREFRHLSQRNVFLHTKDGSAWPYAPWFAQEWLTRLQHLSFFEVIPVQPSEYTIGKWASLWKQMDQYYDDAYSRLDEARVKRLATQYKIDYWIVPVSVSTAAFPEVYRSGAWKVVRVSAM